MMESTLAFSATSFVEEEDFVLGLEVDLRPVELADERRPDVGEGG